MLPKPTPLLEPGVAAGLPAVAAVLPRKRTWRLRATTKPPVAPLNSGDLTNSTPRLIACTVPDWGEEIKKQQTYLVRAVINKVSLLKPQLASLQYLVLTAPATTAPGTVTVPAGSQDSTYFD
jgi:hypothetical protein